MLRQHYKTPDDFKAAIKVGDFLTAWSTGKVVQVTAYGKKNRFLAVDVYGQETVYTMTANTGWTKVDKPNDWGIDEGTY